MFVQLMMWPRLQSMVEGVTRDIVPCFERSVGDCYFGLPPRGGVFDGLKRSILFTIGRRWFSYEVSSGVSRQRGGQMHAFVSDCMYEHVMCRTLP